MVEQPPRGVRSVQGSRPLEIIGDNICIVYEARTGDIIQVHRVTTVRGGTHPHQRYVEAQALEFSSRHPSGRDRSKVAVLHVLPADIKPRTRYRVDPDAKRLVVLERDTPPPPDYSSPRF